MLDVRRGYKGTLHKAPHQVPLGLVWEERAMGALYIISVPGLKSLVLLGTTHMSHCPTAH